MSRPELLPETMPYAKALCAMSGEKLNAVIHAAVLYLFKHETARKPEFRHYQAVVLAELKRFRGEDRAALG